MVLQNYQILQKINHLLYKKIKIFLNFKEKLKLKKKFLLLQNIFHLVV